MTETTWIAAALLLLAADPLSAQTIDCRLAENAELAACLPDTAGPLAAGLGRAVIPLAVIGALVSFGTAAGAGGDVSAGGVAGGGSTPSTTARN